ncbi:MAG: PAS domain S-box protein [Elusimicrobia bacterium]|nr:PAS domain S-box protein [Elusimicrobiota bacterium]
MATPSTAQPPIAAAGASQDATSWRGWSCAAVAALAAAALLGRALDSPLLASVIATSIPMAPSTAVAFLLLAASLHPAAPWSRSRGARLGLLLPVLLLAAPALATFAAIVLRHGWAAIASASPSGAWRQPWAMSPLTAGCLAAIALAAALDARGGERRLSAAAVWGAALAAALSSVVLIGYLYDVPLFYGGLIVPMAAPTAAGILLLAGALLGKLGPRFWPWSVFAGDSPRALMMRSFVPLSAALVLLMGWAHIRLPARPVLDGAIILAAIAGVMWLSGLISARASVAIELANRRLRSSERRHRLILETAMDGFWIADLEGRLLEVNETYCRMSGYERRELLSMRISQIDALESPAETAAHIGRLLARGEERFETLHRRKDGTTFPVDICVQHKDFEGGRMVVFLRDITERKRAEAELERLNAAICQAVEAVIITDPQGDIQFVNPAFQALTGYAREEALGKNPRLLKSGRQSPAFYRDMWTTLLSGRTWKGRMINKRKDGTTYAANASISPVRAASGEIVNFVAVQRDVTEELRLDDQLRQAQKMESVGRLAGGVAHDINNVLTAINGYSMFVMEALPEGHPQREDVKEILQSSERATRLTKQLLAFSRKQILQPRVLDLRTCMDEIIHMLRQILGEDIQLATTVAAVPCMVKVDAGQVDQVIINLAVNARDAMPKGGTLTVATEVVEQDEGFRARHPDFPRGRMVRLSAHDTGCGMTDEVKARIFEPFFTTKGAGKGTGLGLATVFGIVKQSGGEIEVESSPEAGSTFRIYLPEAPAEPRERPAAEDGAGTLRGKETVLVVEDEALNRKVMERVLTAKGYTLLVAVDGADALRALERRGKPVDLVITDVVMPGMGGRELALRVSRERLAPRILYISGYTDDALGHQGLLEPGVAFLSKPFSPTELLRKVRAVLDAPADLARA